MADTIDSLVIEVGASSSNAASEIGKLATELSKLKSAVKGGAPDLVGWSAQLKTLAESTKNLDGSAMSNISKMAQSLKALADAGKVSIAKNLGERIGEVGKGLKSFKSIKPEAVDNFANMAKALHGLDGLDTDALKAFSKLKVPEISRGAANGITRIAKAISDIDDDSIARIRNFADAMSGLAGVDFRGLAAMERLQIPKAPKGESSLWTTFAKTMGNEAKKAVQHIVSLSKALGTKLLSAAVVAGKAMANLTKNIVAAPFKRVADAVSNLKKRIDGLTSSFARIMLYRGIRTIIKEIGEAMKYGEENAYWFSKKFGEATRYISEAYDAYASATEMMKNQVGAAWATLFANIQPIIEAITDLVARAAQVVTQFFASLGGKTTYLKATKYAKDWKDATDEATKAAKEWKNQIMGFDEINRLEEQSDSNNSAAKSKTPDYSQMFEEVAVESEIGDLANKMRDLWNNQDWKDLGELIADTLNDLFPSENTWKQWGAKLGNGINGAVQTAYYTLKNIEFVEWGRRIASGVNEALEAIDFTVWGGLLVRKTTAAFDFLIGYIRGLNFETVGKSIGDFFRGAFDEATAWLDSYTWGDMSAKLWQKIKDLTKGFDIPTFASSLGNFLVTAANSAADFLNGIDFNDVIDTIIGSLKSFFDNIHIEDIKSAISNLWTALKKAFKDSMAELGNWLKGKNEDGYFNQLGKDFNTGLTNLLNDSDTLFDAVPWGEIGTAISDFLEGLDWFGIFKSEWNFVGGKLVDAAKWIFSEDGSTVRHLLEAVLCIKAAFALATPLVTAAGKALVSGIGHVLAPLASVIFSPTGLIIGAVVAAGVLIIKNWDTIKEKATAIWGSVKETVSNVWNGVKEKASGVWESTKTTVTGAWNDIKQAAGDVWTSVKETVGNVWNGVKETANDVWGSAKESVLTAWSAIKEKADAVWPAVKETVSTAWDGIQEKASGVWNRIKGAVTTAWDNVKEKTSTTWDNVKTDLSTTWDGLKTTAGTVWGGIKGAVTSATGEINTDSVSDTKTLYNDVTGLYDQIHQQAVTTFSDIARAVPQIMNYVSDEVKRSVQEISGAFQQMNDDILSVIHKIESLNWRIPRPKIPKITWQYDTVKSGDGSSYQIPQFNVHWFAKGGVIDRKMLFGVGEAGTEAIVPLERNTEWISRVAQEMNNQRRQNNSGNDDIIVAFYTAAAQIVQAIQESNNGRADHVSFNVNGREFFRATFDDQQAVAREKGISMVIA